MEPQEIIGRWMAGAASLALTVDVATGWLLWDMGSGSLSVRAAFVHNLIDAFGSIAVAIGAAAVVWLDWNWVDSTISLMIAGYILWQVYKMMHQAIRVMMEGAPPDLDLYEMVESATKPEGVVGIHHLHVWELDTQHRA